MPRRAPRSRRRTTLLALGALVALGAPAVATLSAAPALADAGCLQETNDTSGVFPTACDDSTPPVTDTPTMTPAANILGYINTGDVTFDLHSHYTDADPDPITYQCQFWDADTTVAPDPNTGTWDTCDATFTKTGLADTVNAEYHLRARAVDAGDSDPLRIPSDGNPLNGTETDTPDYDFNFDATQEITFKIDTVAPNTFLTNVPTDSIRPDEPTTLSQNVTLDLNSNEPVYAYVCQLNGKRIGCHQGANRLIGLGPGMKTFSTHTIDRAANVDPVPAVATWWVPQNLGLGMARYTGKNCTRVLDPTAFAGDYLQCSKNRAEIHFTAPSNRTREIRLIAPAGPNLGVVEVSIGEGRWYPVDLYAKKAQAMHTYLVRDQYSPPKGGEIRIRVKSVTPARPYVRVDAVLARD